MDSSIRTEEEKNIDYGYGPKDESECPEAEYPPSLQNTYLRIADFTISKEDALRYVANADNAHHFKLSKWRDIHFSVYI